jgi:hypothetical protein
VQYVRVVDVDNLDNTTLKRIFKNIVVMRTEHKDGTFEKELDFNYYFMDMSMEDLIKKSGRFSTLKG